MNSQVVIGNAYKLVPATPADLPVLLKWRNDSDWMTFCSHRKYRVSKDELAAELRDDFSSDRWLQYLIYGLQDREAIGTIYAYNYSEALRSTFVTLFVERQFRGTPAATHAFALLSHHLFHSPMRRVERILLHVYEQNSRSLRPLLRIGAREVKRDTSKSGDRRVLLELEAKIENVAVACTIMKRVIG